MKNFDARGDHEIKDDHPLVAVFVRCVADQLHNKNNQPTNQRADMRISPPRAYYFYNITRRDNTCNGKILICMYRRRCTNTYGP